MNKKNNDGWILCPSKSFPGKFYYFNVVNGEAAWCLTDAEKKALSKESPIKRVSDKSHSYPEPNTPPVESPTSNICYNFTQPNIPLSFMPTPQIFGQPVFPKYVPNEYMPYVLPMPQMFVPNKPEKKKRVFDQITQTSEPDRDMFVQCCTMPLSKRFSTYQTKVPKTSNTHTTDSNWWILDSQKMNFGASENDCDIKNQIITETCAKDSIFTKPHNENNIKNTQKKSLIKEPIFKPQKTETVKENTGFNNKLFKPIQNELELNININSRNIQNNQDIFNDFKQPTQSVNTKENIKTTDIINRGLTLKENTSDNIIEENVGSSNNLNSNDLRFFLEAKRRKSVHDQDNTPNINNDTSVKKEKHVTFDLGTPTDEMDITDSELHSMDVTEANSPQVLNISYLKSLSGPYLKTDPWYIVIDMGVLLDDFEFIDDFVKKDKTCRLLVPNSVCTYIRTISVGEYAGRSRVMLARKAIRRLTAPGQHVVLQPPVMEKVSTSAIDGIVECCVQVGQEHHVVLITTDTELYNKAVTSDIHTYKLDDVKNSITDEPEVTFDIKKINFKINNDNVFTQNKNKINNDNAFTQNKNLENQKIKVNNDNIFAKTTNFENHNDSHVFKVPMVKNNGNSKKSVINASTSPIIFDKIIDITRTKRYLNDMKVNQRIPEDDATIESSIEEIRNLSIEGISEKRKENSMEVHRFGDLNFRKSIINTNFEKQNNVYDNRLQNSEPKQIQKVIMKPLNDSKSDIDKVTSTSEFKTKCPQSIKVLKAQTKNENRQINAYTVDDMLKKFHVKDSFICGRIVCRMDEWVCCFVQIMEDFLTYVLMNNSNNIQNNLRPPWTLQEAVHCIKDLYSTDTAIKTVTERMTDIISNSSDKNDNLKKSIKSADFMKLFGCGVLLVESLKPILPNSEYLQDCEKSMKLLQQSIQDPSSDVELPVINTPLRRSESDDPAAYRNICPKKPSEIISYLKKHFSAWSEYNEADLTPENINIQDERSRHHNPTIIRTFGKDLNTIIIDKAKQITFGNAVSEKLNKLKANIDENERVLSENKQGDINITHNNDYFESGLNPLINGEKKTEIIRNFNTILDFEENIKNKVSLDMEGLDYSENDYLSTKSTDNFYMGDAKTDEYNQFAQFNDNFADDVINDDALFDYAPINDEKAHNNDDCNDDSGIENESLRTCSFIKSFLSELSESFKIIYSFVDESIQEFRCDEMQHETKRKLYNRANETHLHVSDIIGKLKRIIEREAADNTKLKSLIIKAGVEAVTDKRMTRYRQVVIKCLEQAQLLEGALKIMLALTNEHCDITAVVVDENDHNVRYFNIFE